MPDSFYTAIPQYHLKRQQQLDIAKAALSSAYTVLHSSVHEIVMSDGKELIVYDQERRLVLVGTAHGPLQLVSYERGPGGGHGRREQGDGVSEESLNSGYYKRFFVEVKKIGAGSSGAVWLVRHHINYLELGEYALKKVPIGDSLEWLKIVLTEVKILEQIKVHPNIIGYKHSWLEMDQTADFGPKVPCLFILMEYANGGNLEDFVFSRREGLLDTEIWIFFLDLLFGIDYLHSMGIIHRDIKSPNILLHQDVDSKLKSRRNRLMISDFGTCVNNKFVKEASRTGNTGTPEWNAPELLIKDSEGKWGDYSACCDMWGLGLCLHFMAFGRLPWKASRANLKNLYEEIMKCHVELSETPSRSSDMIYLIKALLQKDPSRRPTSRDLILSLPIRNLVKSLNDPQLTRLLADVILQGPHTTSFSARSPVQFDNSTTATSQAYPKLHFDL
uniref:non-specific serine/threonine protein kinase n=1 Tax=Arcella intermedia TaxID=1963864 RepID=A0A6B2L3U0_9EUKA